MKKRSPVKRVLLVLLVLVVLAAALYALGALYPDGRADGDNGGLADWMGELDGSRRLSEINLPGTHDSATQYIFPAYFLQDQDTTVARQLENGYRYLDVRVALSKDGGDLLMIHAFGSCRRGASLFSGALRYNDFVDAAKSFLESHPGETVIFCIKPEKGSDDVARVRALIEERIALEPELWYTENRIPTLDEARGKIVLCRRYDAALGLDFDWLDQGDPTVLADPTEAHAINDAQTLYVQDRYHYAVADKWEAVRFTLENSRAGENAFCLNFLSTAQGKLPHPRSFAREMNALFAGYALEKGAHYGVVLFDFAEPALARQVVESN
jgi:1-phosphatidylinositol phosphodiesterase